VSRQGKKRKENGIKKVAALPHRCPRKSKEPAPKGEPSAKRKQNGRKATKKPVPLKGGWCGSARWNADEGGARVGIVGRRPCAASGFALSQPTNLHWLFRLLAAVTTSFALAVLRDGFGS